MVEIVLGLLTQRGILDLYLSEVHQGGLSRGVAEQH